MDVPTAMIERLSAFSGLDAIQFCVALNEPAAMIFGECSWRICSLNPGNEVNAKSDIECMRQATRHS